MLARVVAMLTRLIDRFDTTVARLDSPVPQIVLVVVVVLRSRPFPGGPSETPQSVTDHEDDDGDEDDYKDDD